MNIKNKEIKLSYTDMWGHGSYQFNPYNCYFTKLLSLFYDVSIVKDDPDILFFSCFGETHRSIKATVKIFFCGENSSPPGVTRMIKPDYSFCDLSLSQFPDSQRNLYFPLWVLFVNWFYEKVPLDLPSNPTFLVNPESLLSTRTKYINLKSDFCNFINNNPVSDRVLLYQELSKITKVNSFGKLFNNVGYLLGGDEGEKLKILKSHRFSIAYENSWSVGYNTEKIIHPYSVGSIAIYSGGLDRSIFNSKALFYRDDYSSLQQMIEEIGETYRNEELFLAKVSEPLFVNNKIPTRFYPISILNWINESLSHFLL